ncbi:hypothetical protein [Pseudomonas aegrilactucae]|uniref:Uncharacterized protein n=1 Tax=Pseudomonas aegrilactucae TaxID=2854028 RepID=A0A9Q2XF88_9PSED|nr:hypothetical protein [Pseudomonas aegrilactucae]MBV6286156.1 hypothetical protein [Pseudomonas aegrilactucae]
MLIIIAVGLVAVNLYFLSIGSVHGYINHRIGGGRHVVYTLRDNADAFYLTITANLVFCAGMAIVGVILAWYALRQLRKRPTKPNGEPWWFI